MALWDTHDLETKVRHVLERVPPVTEGHQLGPAYVTTYQLAIGVERAFPGTAAALGKSVGGVGTGSNDSLARYLGQVLSAKIGADPNYFVEGAFLSNQDVERQVFAGPYGSVTSSTGTPYSLSMFRLRR